MSGSSPWPCWAAERILQRLSAFGYAEQMVAWSRPLLGAGCRPFGLVSRLGGLKQADRCRAVVTQFPGAFLRRSATCCVRLAVLSIAGNHSGWANFADPQ